MKKRKNKIQAIDFFCSGGGVTCGFKLAGIDVIGGIDIDSSCKETYEINNNAKFLTADISTLPLSALKEKFGIRRNQRNLIFVGCSPCQYYSNIQTDKTKSNSSRLLLDDFQKFVEYYRPGYLFIENVPGFESKQHSPLSKFKNKIIELGYTFDSCILNAKDFGVPQNRRRFILIATRLRKDIRLPKPLNEFKTVHDAIGNKKKFPRIKAGYTDSSQRIHTSASLSKLNLERIKNTPANGGDRRNWDDRLCSESYLQKKSHYDVYGRMSWHKPAPTITTRFNSYSNGRFGHPTQNRAISLREGATLQSFPYNYSFRSTSKNMIAKMIGNAVPPLFAKEIAKSF